MECACVSLNRCQILGPGITVVVTAIFMAIVTRIQIGFCTACFWVAVQCTGFKLGKSVEIDSGLL